MEQGSIKSLEQPMEQGTDNIPRRGKKNRKKLNVKGAVPFMGWEEYSSGYWLREKALDAEWKALEAKVMELLREYTLEVMVMDEYANTLADMEICSQKMKQHKANYVLLQQEYSDDGNRYYLNLLLENNGDLKKKWGIFGKKK